MCYDKDQTRLEDAKKEIREKLEKYISKSPYTFNSDEKQVDGIITGLAMKKIKAGRFYCPCRIVTGVDKEDRKKVCPCIWHRQEIEKDGTCHCRLFVKK